MTVDNLEIEPNEYFEKLKDTISEVEYKQLEVNKKVLAAELTKAKKLGQKNLLHKASFMWEVIEKEMILHATGFRKFVDRRDVCKFIDSVKPKNSVKIVELENFPRSIPDANVEYIEKARDLELFDVFLVLYTDFTNEEVNTPAQKAMVARNTDPIVFGMFTEEKLKVRHDRLYLITDWEDEFCDLTFTKLIDEMGKIGIKNPEKIITIDHNQINRIVKESKEEIDTVRLDNSLYVPKNRQKKSFVSWLKNFLSNGS